MSLERRSSPPNDKCAYHQPCEQRHDGRNTDKAELLGDYGKQKIGMRLRQIKKFFHAATQADTQPFAPPECDQSMTQLVALPVGIVPRIHESEKPLHAI